MREPLTIEKLKEYGFNDEQIARLSDPLIEYTCQIITNEGHFFASNFPPIIYTGTDAEERIRGVGITRFRTFDEMYSKALEMGAVPLEDNSHLDGSTQKALQHANRNIFLFDFNSWLRVVKNWVIEDEDAYKSFLTMENWKAFISFHLEKKWRIQQKYEEEKAQWRVTSPFSGDTLYNNTIQAVSILPKALASDSYQYFKRDITNCLEDWQYAEPASKSYPVRFDLDKEAYINTFFDPVHRHKAQYDEKILIERLIRNLSKATHPYFEGYRLYLEKRLSEAGGAENKATVETNNVTLSTIEDWLFPFKYEGAISDGEYLILISSLLEYFETGFFPKLAKKIKVGKVNMKRFGWALNQIYKSEKSGSLSSEYLQFAKDWISVFEGVEFDKSDIKRSNLYKYFTTKTE